MIGCMKVFTHSYDPNTNCTFSENSYKEYIVRYDYLGHSYVL